MNPGETRPLRRTVRLCHTWGGHTYIDPAAVQGINTYDTGEVGVVVGGHVLLAKASEAELAEVLGFDLAGRHEAPVEPKTAATPDPGRSALDPIADCARVDWMQGHPCNIKWNHERGWVVSFGFPFGEAEGPTLRDAIDAAMAGTRGWVSPLAGRVRENEPKGGGE